MKLKRDIELYLNKQEDSQIFNEAQKTKQKQGHITALNSILIGN